MNCILPQNTLIRHLFCIGMGILIQFYLYADTFFHMLTMAYPMYAIMATMDRKVQHKYACGYLFIYMSGQHCYTMWTNYGGYDLNITTHTMLLFCKLWGLAWCYRDGGKNNKNEIDELTDD